MAVVTNCSVNSLAINLHANSESCALAVAPNVSGAYSVEPASESACVAPCALICAGTWYLWAPRGIGPVLPKGCRLTVHDQNSKTCQFGHHPSDDEFIWVLLRIP